MWLSLCFYIIISIIIITIIHYLFNYCKDNFTTKKTKDVVNIEIEKYKSILEEIDNHSHTISLPEKCATNQENELLAFANQCMVNEM